MGQPNCGRVVGGGTADDPDLDFTVDRLRPAEGFTGTEDTVARTAWAFVRGTADRFRWARPSSPASP
ncbi:hypothetical protein ADK67_37715 [Saccharothrix sp. NRRL B-16348]|uniref:hypothetical protein n=1 Tax=Saccharothrix sp. NRRL B-16348 TaxID=1415542 RepID=UPI0006AE15A6|nr:hypothetical protein [Saccharothrix sp. NRRL B-16348]KOX17785.1 hypothetical protein ADK67_37715 [Saccharothrix sp. NRRL B-16348]